jgi:hypothetical protein
MWCSHPGATCRLWIESAGLVIDHERFVAEGTGGHALFVATGTHAPIQQ